jgi:hypothetical protein
MSLAEEFARLMAQSGTTLPNLPTFAPAGSRSVVKTRTVYSVGEAISRKEPREDAKLEASTL